MRKYGAWIGICVLLVLIISQSVAAFGKDQPEIKRESIFAVIQKGYAMQASLHGKKMSVDKMAKQLAPYFTDNFLQVFTDENEGDAKGGGGYLLPQKPPFSFSEQTKLAYHKQHSLLYVYEKGKDGYEIVTMQQSGGTWKMAAYHVSDELLPEIQKAEQVK
ncbi:DUF3993 domain-containing protein [Ectobacillus ponti]|uniref:DUF3993 domain-containing protein n=1 Tax=Ectobacillus ponti TaxID=2961894 RepID=A0AA41X8K1_9BACI|nr:DUF3993 domain-containing protein [Ectobacillus ponti]MCP8970881.1 DUF3993 domain-containing protein [Ectobacillus ponti]